MGSCMHSWPVLAKPNEAFKVQGNVFARVQQQPAPLTEVGRFQHGGGGAGLQCICENDMHWIPHPDLEKSF